MDGLDLEYSIISIIISVGTFFIIKSIIHSKLRNLSGIRKLVHFISIIIIVIEATYLSFVFGVFDLAGEVIASMGLAFALISFALFNHLKNIVAGIELYLNSEINIGDRIRMGEMEGNIVEIRLLKTVAVTDDGKKIFIPNLKFSEEIAVITKNGD